MTTILRVKIRCLSRNERTALEFLADRISTATCHIQRRTALPDSASTRRMLKRMERDGLVVGESWQGGNVRWWKITEAGSEAIAEPQT